MRYVFILWMAALAFNLWAREVSQEEAACVATRWSDENRCFLTSPQLLQPPVAIRTKTGKLLYYKVYLSHHQLMIVAGDTHIPPIIAVIQVRDKDLPSSHPLLDLIQGDLENRHALLVESASVDATRLSYVTQNKRIWEHYLSSAPPLAKASIHHWIEGWKEGGYLTHWYQESYNRYGSWPQGEVYDRYTPKHTLTGCVATAGAALLQYFKIPKGPHGITRDCHLEGQPLPLTTLGGAYDWSHLPSDWPLQAKELSNEAKELLGRASYDMGVCVYTWYAPRMSGSAPSTLGWALPLFGIQARYVKGEPNPKTPQLLPTEHIYPQILANTPVVLGLMGKLGGHAALAVGYGETTDGTPLTRLFMGWGGWYDTWYALPDVEKAGTPFTLLRDALTDLSVTK